ncbi:hypothetical protein [Nonomuraea diastatica]|uniref:Uncharacterized protein n=1 Tax=Nonomuraea diastatica TaxID=1848329 RepID=A0A4R4X0X9_9ACTN|nr:hypothetical protein [Nonomuraea diastatica]TDD23838.1 hypothetical protein E1294_07490 [Nonomuraea diastatica]
MRPVWDPRALSSTSTGLPAALTTRPKFPDLLGHADLADLPWVKSSTRGSVERGLSLGWVAEGAARSVNGGAG